MIKTYKPNDEARIQAMQLRHENHMAIREWLGARSIHRISPDGIWRIELDEGHLDLRHADYVCRDEALGVDAVPRERFKEEWQIFYPKVCAWCEVAFDARRPMQKFCSSACRERDRYARVGMRSTKEQRARWHRQRISRPGMREHINRQARERYRQVQGWIRRHKLEVGCADCGYKEHWAALDFDHVRGEKEINVCNAKSISQAKREAAKCEVVCACCHRIRTVERMNPCDPDVFKKRWVEV